jgi:hypothetical protein
LQLAEISETTIEGNPEFLQAFSILVFLLRGRGNRALNRHQPPVSTAKEVKTQ